MISPKEGVGTGTAPAWHTGFLLMEPAIRRQVRALFHHRPRQERDEALAEVTAVALMRYLRHLEVPETEPFDPDALARTAARHVRNSGRACGRENGRDVLSPTAQRRRGFKVEHLQPSCEAERLRMRIDPRQEVGEPSPGPSLSAHPNGNGESQSARLVHERGRRRKAEKRLRDADIEFEAARRIQKKLMPAAPLAAPGFDIAGLNCPAEATGSDYFDFVPMRGEAKGVVVKTDSTTKRRDPMPRRFRAVAFDLDVASVMSLREALPDWRIEAVRRATAASLEREGGRGEADLLVVNARGSEAETLGLCRGLRSQPGWARTPLLVLVPPDQEALVRAALKAGAHSCLVLPVHAKELAHMVGRTHEGNRPGRHTLNLHQAQQEDRWRDDGGQG